MNVFHIPRSEAVALVQQAVLEGNNRLNALDVLRLRRETERAPRIAFGTFAVNLEGLRCGCPLVQAGITDDIGTGLNSGTVLFAAAFDDAVCAEFGLHQGSHGVLILDD